MAGLKNRTKSDSSSPNMVLVIALILFVIVSIGLGLLAYYGYDGQEALRSQLKQKNLEMDKHKNAVYPEKLARQLAMLALGIELTEEDQKTFKGDYEQFDANADHPLYKDQKAILLPMKQKFALDLKKLNLEPAHYEVTYIAEAKAAQAEVRKLRAMLEDTQKQLLESKSTLDGVLAKAKTDNEEIRAQVKKDNEAALAKAKETNSKFGEMEALAKKNLADKIKQQQEDTVAMQDRDQQLVRANTKIAELDRKLANYSVGTAVAANAGGADLHSLLLDISRGKPLWDRPLGKVLRVDPINMQVYIDIGSKVDLKPDVTFNVFTTNSSGRADRQLKGTIEVIRVLNETSSLCRITSLYDDRGESVPLNSEAGRARGIKAIDSLIREGDLCFNMFFGMHVFIAGNVNFVGTNAISPAEQNMQLSDFIAQLRKQNVIVDGYINLLNGQMEGAMTQRTRLLIRGDIAPLNGTQDETNRIAQIKETFGRLKQQAIEQGMFVISAENFANVAGYRSVQALANKELGTTFRPSLPWTGAGRVPQMDAGVAPAVPMPAEPKKEMMEKQ